MSDELVDWSVATRVGHMVAGTGVSIPLAERPPIIASFASSLERADALVRAFTRLEPPEPAGSPVILGRAGWIDANVEGFKGLMAPLAKKVSGRVGAVGRTVGRPAMGAQMGLLLGYLSQKVLGQYDLLLAAGGKGKVYFVAPNIVAAERRWDLDPDHFRLWIALHEVTHRTQFTAVPWLRDHVALLIERYLGAIEIDPQRMKEAIGRLAGVLRGGREAMQETSIIDLFLSPAQKEVVLQMQALMTVVEGHGNFVMDQIGAREIPTFDEMKAAIEARRGTAGAAEKLFQRMIGLDMKYRQYSEGEEFVSRVFDLEGMDGVNRVWRSPDALPTTEELQDPKSWLERVS